MPWPARAARARAVLVDEYWDRRAGLFRPFPGVIGQVRARLPGAPWHPWWQAHALEVCCDAVEVGDDPAAAQRVRTLVATIRQRLGTDWRGTDFVDDLAWLGLATWRAHGLGLVDAAIPLGLAGVVLRGHDPVLGGFRWRFGDDFHNVPATAPAAILLARAAAAAGEPSWLALARDSAEWLHATVVQPDGVVRDGARPRGGRLVAEGPVWSYNVGTVAGLDVELAEHEASPVVRAERLARAARVLRAGTRVLTGPRGLWRDEWHDGTGSDPQLFRGILAGHLSALVRADPAGTDDLAQALRTQAEAVWAVRDHRGRIGPAWSSPDAAARVTLAAHCSGAMLLQAAARLPGAPPS